MNKSKKVIWDRIKKLYCEDGFDATRIMEALKRDGYFDEKIIPSIQTIYDYICRSGFSKERKKDKLKQKEIDELKRKLKRQRFQKAKQAVLDGLNNGSLTIDDLTKDNIGRLQTLIKDLSDKIGNSKDMADKVEVVKLLDKVVSTLLKARILEDKPTDKVDVDGKLSLQDEMREFFDEPADKNTGNTHIDEDDAQIK